MEKVFVRFPVILVTGRLVSFSSLVFIRYTRDKLRTLELLSARIHNNIVQHLDHLPRLARMVDEHVLEKRF